MSQQTSAAELQRSLADIIHRMQVIQQQIGGSGQPASMHELDALTALGRQYAKLVEQLHDGL